MATDVKTKANEPDPRVDAQRRAVKARLAHREGAREVLTELGDLADRAGAGRIGPLELGRLALIAAVVAVEFYPDDED